MSSSGTHPSFPIEKMTVIFLTSWSPWSPANVRTSTLSPSELPCTWCLSNRMQRRKIFRNLRNLEKILKKHQQKDPAKISLLVYFFKKNNCWDKEAFWTIQAFTILLTGTTSAALTASNQQVNSWVSPPRGRRRHGRPIVQASHEHLRGFAIFIWDDMPRKFDEYLFLEAEKKNNEVCSQMISMDAKRFLQAMEISIKNDQSRHFGPKSEKMDVVTPMLTDSLKASGGGSKKSPVQKIWNFRKPTGGGHVPCLDCYIKTSSSKIPTQRLLLHFGQFHSEPPGISSLLQGWFRKRSRRNIARSSKSGRDINMVTTTAP